MIFDRAGTKETKEVAEHDTVKGSIKIESNSDPDPEEEALRASFKESLNRAKEESKTLSKEVSLHSHVSEQFSVPNYARES